MRCATLHANFWWFVPLYKCIVSVTSLSCTWNGDWDRSSVYRFVFEVGNLTRHRQRNEGRSKGIGTNLYVVCPFREDSLPWTRIEMEFFAEWIVPRTQVFTGHGCKQYRRLHDLIYEYFNRFLVTHRDTIQPVTGCRFAIVNTGRAAILILLLLGK